MFELGKKDEIFGADKLVPLRDVYGRSERLPFLKKDESVIAGFDQGLGERILVCETLEDMQQIYDAYARGFALRLNWYRGDDPGFILAIPPQETR